MKLKELLKVIPDDTGVTISGLGPLDRHYAYTYDIEQEPLDYYVVELAALECDELFVHVLEAYDPGSPFLPSEVQHD